MSSKGRGKRLGSARSGGKAKKQNFASAEGRRVGIQPDEPDNAAPADVDSWPQRMIICYLYLANHIICYKC